MSGSYLWMLGAEKDRTYGRKEAPDRENARRIYRSARYCVHERKVYISSGHGRHETHAFLLISMADRSRQPYNAHVANDSNVSGAYTRFRKTRPAGVTNRDAQTLQSGPPTLTSGNLFVLTGTSILAQVRRQNTSLFNHRVVARMVSRGKTLRGRLAARRLRHRQR